MRRNKQELVELGLEELQRIESDMVREEDKGYVLSDYYLIPYGQK